MSDKAIVRQRMEIKDKEERIRVAGICIANGYSAREVAVKPANGKGAKKYYIEYWKEEN